jgi:hypothetical protein
MWITIRAWAGSARAGRCKACRKPIVWVLTEGGKHYPLDLGFTVREVVRHPETGARFLVLARADRHDCPARRRKMLTPDRTPAKPRPRANPRSQVRK